MVQRPGARSRKVPSKVSVWRRTLANKGAAAAVHVEVVDAIWNSRNRRGIPLLKRALRNPDPTVRMHAINALLGFQVKDALPLVRARLKDPDGSVRSAAATFVGILSFKRPRARGPQS